MRAGVQGEGRWAVDGVARLVFVGGQGGRTGRQGSGVAPETLRRWRDRTGAMVVAETRQPGRGRDGGVEGFAGRGRAIGARERDIDGGVGFFRGQARPGTALMVACVDGFRDRFGAGPVCGAPAASPGCGFVTPCGCRVSGSGPVSRMAAGLRGAGPRHPRGPCRFLHGRVRVPRDARPVVGAGLGVFCQVVIGQCGVSFPSEKAVGFSPVRNWPVIARVLLFHCIRA